MGQWKRSIEKWEARFLPEMVWKITVKKKKKGKANGVENRGMTGKSLCLWPCSWVNKNRNKKTSRPQETDTATNKGLPCPRLLSCARAVPCWSGLLKHSIAHIGYKWADKQWGPSDLGGRLFLNVIVFPSSITMTSPTYFSLLTPWFD